MTAYNMNIEIGETEI